MAIKKIEEITSGNCKVIVRRDTDWQEFQVYLYIDGRIQEEATYYTDDKNDARCTARAMIRDHETH